MKTSNTQLEKMRNRESFRATAYKDGFVNQVQMYSIGYGHQIQPFESHLKTTTITKQTANDLFARDVKPVEDLINKSVKHSLTQSQFDALVDFGFNCGTGALANIISTWNDTKDPNAVAERIKLYNKITVDGKKVVSQELVSRRAENAKMFMNSRSATPLLLILAGSALAYGLLS